MNDVIEDFYDFGKIYAAKPGAILYFGEKCDPVIRVPGGCVLLLREYTDSGALRLITSCYVPLLREPMP